MTSAQSSDLNWYAARAKPGLAAKALEQLEAADFEVNLPMYRENKKMIPLLPGYIFIRMAHDDSEFSAVHQLSSIYRLVSAGSAPSPIPHREMNAFLDRLNSGAFDSEVEQDNRPLPWFGKNEILAVTSGPFTGHTGTFSHVRKGAVVVNMKFLGGTIEVPLKGHQVQRLM